MFLERVLKAEKNFSKKKGFETKRCNKKMCGLFPGISFLVGLYFFYWLKKGITGWEGWVCYKTVLRRFKTYYRCSISILDFLLRRLLECLWSIVRSVVLTKLYVPVVTLSAQDNAKLLQQLKPRFNWQTHWIKCQLVVSPHKQNPCLG